MRELIVLFFPLAESDKITSIKNIFSFWLYIWILKLVSKFLFLCLFFSKIQVTLEVDKENGSHLLVNDNNKYKSMLIRTYSSVWMIGGFVFVIYMGHLYIWAMIVVIQIFMAKELFNLLRRAHEDRRLPGFRLLNWWGGPDLFGLKILFLPYDIIYY